ncbi:MAG: methyltransferase MtaB domain-containing protein [Nitrososphaeria archaeon]
MRFKEVTLSPDTLIFGRAKYPLRYGHNLEVGKGQVIPEIKYFPRVDKDVKEEYGKITESILKRAVDLDIRSLQLETELTYLEMRTKDLPGDITQLQRHIIDRYAQEYGLNIGFRVTVADIRDLGRPKHDEDSYMKIMETFESVASNGADVLSIESEGGKELFNYAIIRQDILGVVASIGQLAALDMKKLWKDIVKIANNKHVIAGGDSACAFANTAMRLAGGKRDNVIAHSLAALVRVMSASRSLVAYEEGAVGPGKDCAYENVFIKAITGYPMSTEGKSAAVAHSSLVGNIIAATCDLWSNEQTENINLFGGCGPEVFLEILYYDTKIMNTALEMGKEKELKSLFVKSDKYVDPQAYVLAPEVAYEICKAIVGEEDFFSRTLTSAYETTSMLLNDDRLALAKNEIRFLEATRTRLEGLNKNPSKVQELLTSYEPKVTKLRIRDYFDV